MFSYSEGQVRQLMKRLDKEGFTPAHLTKLGQSKDLSLFKEVLDGQASINSMMIDCDADPFVPEGWKVLMHRKHGKIKWNKKNFINVSFSGNSDLDIRNYFVNTSPLCNVNVLDFLLKEENKHLIPDEWAQGISSVIKFCGTIYYSDDFEKLLVRTLGYYRHCGWAPGFQEASFNSLCLNI